MQSSRNNHVDTQIGLVREGTRVWSPHSAAHVMSLKGTWCRYGHLLDLRMPSSWHVWHHHDVGNATLSQECDVVESPKDVCVSVCVCVCVCVFVCVFVRDINQPHVWSNYIAILHNWKVLVMSSQWYLWNHDGVCDGNVHISDVIALHKFLSPPCNILPVTLCATSVVLSYDMTTYR